MFKSFEWSYHTDRHQYYNDFSTRNDLYAEKVWKILAKFRVNIENIFITKIALNKYAERVLPENVNECKSYLVYCQHVRFLHPRALCKC